MPKMNDIALGILFRALTTKKSLRAEFGQFANYAVIAQLLREAREKLEGRHAED